MTLYRSIIRQSIITTWQNKYLWFFGLFATLLASNFEVELVNRFLNQNEAPNYSWESFFSSGLFSNQAWQGFIQLAQTNLTSFMGILILLLVLGILAMALVWLSIVSQVALVSNSDKALASDSKKKSALMYHDISSGIKEGNRYFWPVLSLNILVRVIVYGLALITILPFLIWAQGQGIGFGITYLFAFIIFLSIALALALMARYAIAAIVIKGKKIKAGIIQAWQLFWDNWLVSFEMAFILFAISLVSTFFIILAVLIIAIPFVVFYLIALYFDWYFLWVLAPMLAIILSISVVIIGGSIVTVFQTGVWVNLYNQLSGKTKTTSKLERMFS